MIEEIFLNFCDKTYKFIRDFFLLTVHYFKKEVYYKKEIQESNTFGYYLLNI